MITQKVLSQSAPPLEWTVVDAAIIQREERDRAVFEQRIAEGEVRVTDQMLRIKRMQAQGLDTARSEELLRQYLSQLEEWRSTLNDISKVMRSYEIIDESRATAVPMAHSGARA